MITNSEINKGMKSCPTILQQMSMLVATEIIRVNDSINHSLILHNKSLQIIISEAVGYCKKYILHFQLLYETISYTVWKIL